MNQAVGQPLRPEPVEGAIGRADAVAQRRGRTAALEERGRCVGKTAEPRWRWPAIEPHRGRVFAYGFGRRKDEGFLQLKALLASFGITRFDTDGWGAAERHRAPAQPTIGKAPTQKSDRKHINVRTRMKRLVRRTICFANTTTMPDLVLGLFIKRYELGLLL